MTEIIRFTEIHEIVEMPSGMYARSEGPLTDSMTTRIHPEDYPRLISRDNQMAECLTAAKAAGKAREYWVSVLIDVENAGEDGDPMADEFCQFEDEYKASNYQEPEFRQVQPTQGCANWPILGIGMKVMRKQCQNQLS